MVLRDHKAIPGHREPLDLRGSGVQSVRRVRGATPAPRDEQPKARRGPRVLPVLPVLLAPKVPRGPSEHPSRGHRVLPVQSAQRVPKVGGVLLVLPRSVLPDPLGRRATVDTKAPRARGSRVLPVLLVLPAHRGSPAPRVSVEPADQLEGPMARLEETAKVNVSDQLTAALAAGDEVVDGLVVILRVIDECVQREDLDGLRRVMLFVRRSLPADLETSYEREQRIELDMIERLWASS